MCTSSPTTEVPLSVGISTPTTPTRCNFDNTTRPFHLDEVHAFDYDFFGIAPIEGGALDPTVTAAAVSRALKMAGLDPHLVAGTSTGVFVGMMSSEWSSVQMLDFAGVTAFRGAGSGYFMTANRIIPPEPHWTQHGHRFRLLVIVDGRAPRLRCASFRRHHMSSPPNLLVTPALSIFYTQSGLSAPDGRGTCLQQRADGIGRGEGRGRVVLRRLGRRHCRQPADLRSGSNFGRQPRWPQERMPTGRR